MTIAQKRRVQITLDLECYDDLDLDDINWTELLELEGDEQVHVNVKDYHDFF